jgi:hypothetical protein
MNQINEDISELNNIYSGNNNVSTNSTNLIPKKME